MTHQQKTAYLAPLGYEKLLVEELKNIVHVYDRLIVADGPVQKVYWVENIWLNPQLIPIESISHAARTMRDIQRNWWPFAWNYFRRIQLIQEKLPHVSGKPLNFLDPLPASPLGSWTLVDENMLMMASECTSPMPNGEFIFHENKIDPPSRAYLKLWELFTRLGQHPQKNEICVDLGASPGGWTWVLSKLAKKIIACDRSALDERLQSAKNVHFISQSAFGLDMSEYRDASWIFSDVICYPEKLYNFAVSLLNKFPEKKYVFTIKFQGDDHQKIISQFAQLPGTLLHLHHNKHELTWYKI